MGSLKDISENNTTTNKHKFVKCVCALCVGALCVCAVYGVCVQCMCAVYGVCVHVRGVCVVCDAYICALSSFSAGNQVKTTSFSFSSEATRTIEEILRCLKDLVCIARCHVIIIKWLELGSCNLYPNRPYALWFYLRKSHAIRTTLLDNQCANIIP